MIFRVSLASLVVSFVGCSDDSGDPCQLEDQDGIIGGRYTFVLELTDQGFNPPNIKVQNDSDVTLTLNNAGTSEGGFSIDCLLTPNDDGCATESCFPAASTIEPIPAGESASVAFHTPDVEGLYTVRALPGDDARTAQIIVE